jgi:hypothetical protein
VLLIPPDLDRRTGPARGTAVRGILLGALAPGILLWLAIAAIGRLLTGPIAVSAILKFAVTASVSGISDPKCPGRRPSRRRPCVVGGLFLMG